MSYREIFTDDDTEIMLKALHLYKNRCMCYYNRRIIGYGKATELEKKEDMKNKAEEIQQLIDKIVTESI